MSNEHDTKKADKAAGDTAAAEATGERIAKVMARAGLCSRRDAEAWIAAGRVSLNGKKLLSPAVNVQPYDDVRVDGKPLPEAEKTRLFRYHKPRGLVTTAKDPEGRPTVFENLPATLPRVISIGRLDLNSEGLLLLTNDGELARRLELPATGWVRRYRVRVNGRIDPASLTRLAGGIEIEGVRYGGIEAALDRQQGDNAWLTMSLTEGKNREIRNVCAFFGWTVSRLIRLSYGPFQLGHLEKGEIEEVPGKVLRDQLGQPGTTQPLRPHQAQGGKSRPPKPVEGKARAKHIRPDRVYDERADADQNPRPYDRKRTRVWKYVAPTDATGRAASDRIVKDSTPDGKEQRGTTRDNARPVSARPAQDRPVSDRHVGERPRRDDDRQPRRDDDRKPRSAVRPDRDPAHRQDERKPDRPRKYGAATETPARKPREWSGKDTASEATGPRGGSKTRAAKPMGDRPRRDDDRPAHATTRQDRAQGHRQDERKPERPRRDDDRPARANARQDRSQDRRQNERKPDRAQKYAAGTETGPRKSRDWAGKDAAAGSRHTTGGKPAGKGRRGDDRATGKTADLKPRGAKLTGSKPADSKPFGSKPAGSKPAGATPSRGKGGDQRPSGGPGKHAHRQRRP